LRRDKERITGMNGFHFLSMSGYAFYVWGSYALALLAIGVEVLVLRQRKKTPKRRSQQQDLLK
jgi:heme exporter protein CcmD